jgi:hypothetical protein
MQTELTHSRVMSRTHAKWGDLIQQTVGLRSPRQARGGWLVRNSGQENVQVVLKEGKVPRVLIP